jgi:Zn-finger nucleic acid-binding protein
MQQSHFPHNQFRIEIDRCHKCGLIWFDPQELKVISGSQQQPDPYASNEDRERFKTQQRFYETLGTIWADLNSHWKMRMMMRYEATFMLWRFALPLVCTFMLIRTMGVHYNYAPRNGDVFGIYKSAPWQHAIKAFLGSALFAWKPSWFWPALFLVFFWLFAAMAVLNAT